MLEIVNEMIVYRITPESLREAKKYSFSVINLRVGNLNFVGASKVWYALAQNQLKTYDKQTLENLR